MVQKSLAKKEKKTPFYAPEGSIDAKMYTTAFWFKWEFLRRNKEYIKDYKEKISKKIAVANEVPTKVLLYFRKKYDIFFPINPKYSMQHLWKRYNDDNLVQAAIDGLMLSKVANDDIFSMQNKSTLDSVISHYVYGTHKTIIVNKNKEKVIMDLSNPKRLLLSHPSKVNFDSIEIHVNLRASRNAIREGVIAVAMLWKEAYDEGHKINPKDDRTHYGKYNEYLRVYDKKNKTGWTFETMAEKEYPDDLDHFDKHVQRLKRNYQAAKALINGGYKHLD